MPLTRRTSWKTLTEQEMADALLLPLECFRLGRERGWIPAPMMGGQYSSDDAHRLRSVGGFLSLREQLLKDFKAIEAEKNKSHRQKLIDLAIKDIDAKLASDTAKLIGGDPQDYLHEGEPE